MQEERRVAALEQQGREAETINRVLGLEKLENKAAQVEINSKFSGYRADLYKAAGVKDVPFAPPLAFERPIAPRPRDGRADKQESPTKRSSSALNNGGMAVGPARSSTDGAVGAMPYGNAAPVFNAGAAFNTGSVFNAGAAFHVGSGPNTGFSPSGASDTKDEDDRSYDARRAAQSDGMVGSEDPDVFLNTLFYDDRDAEGLHLWNFSGSPEATEFGT